MRRVLSCILALILWGSLVAAEEQRFFSASPLKPEIAKEALRALEADEVPNFAQFGWGAAEPIPDQSVAKFWRNNRLEWEASVKDVRLRFLARAPHSNTEERFEARVKFDQRTVTVQSDRARFKKYAGGIRVRPDKKTSWKLLLSGRDNFDLGILVPKLQSDQRMLMICPVKVERKTGGKSTSEADPLVGPENFELEAVETAVYANGSAAVQSGAGLGYGLMQIFTTPNVFPARLASDESLTKDPSLSLDYEPDTSHSIKTELNRGDYLAGVKVQVLLQNAVQLTRASELSETVYVKTVEFEKDLRLFGEEGDVQAKAIKCALVLTRSERTHKYSREALRMKYEAAPGTSPAGATNLH